MSRLLATGRIRGGMPRQFRLEDYKRWFPMTGELFLRYVKRYDVLPVAANDGPVLAVLIVPWVSTPVAWYALMLAVGLTRRGRAVVLIYDDTGFPEDHLEQEQTVIGKVVDYFARFMSVVRLSDQIAEPTSSADAVVVEEFTKQNIVWIRRGSLQAHSDQQLGDDVRGSLTKSLPLIRAALRRLDLDCLVVPGGVYGTSGLFRVEAEARGVRVATFDTDRRIGQICSSGVAAQNGDIARAFHAVWDEGGPGLRDAIEMGKAEYQTRTHARDSYGFQTGPATGQGEGITDAVVLPMNVEWDTAALGKHVHFANSADWIVSTVEVILDSGDPGPVIVRQHPSERRKLQRSQLDIGSLLADRFGADDRVRFVAAEDPVSSYDLLHSARLVLPYVSTIAIEAAAVGKPVLVSGDAYYRDLGFVRSARSREDYFELLRQGLRGELDLLPEQTDRAWACYYLTAVRNRVPTDFTPHPEDFWDWCGRDPEVLFADPEVSDILRAIDENVPIALLRHRRLMPARSL